MYNYGQDVDGFPTPTTGAQLLQDSSINRLDVHQ
jgi:hypothetical protein